MAFHIRLRDFVLVAYATLFIANRVTGLPQTAKPRIIPRGIPKPPPDYNNEDDTWERLVSKRCTTDQLALESRGWAEAGVLANALNAWKPKSDYQNAMDTYMGTDSSTEKPYFFSYRQRVQNAVTQDYKIHTGKQPGHTYVYVYCDEDETPADFKKDGDICGGNTGAYTWESLGLFWSNVFLVLCPNNYFDEDKTETLASQLQAIRNDTSKAKDMYSLYWNLGTIYFHETFHWQDTVTNPKAYDYDPDDKAKAIYGPQAVKDEATAKNTYANSVIADAYTMVGTAMMLMQTFQLADVPQPLSASTNAASAFTMADFGAAPEGWVGPQNVNDSKSLPDMTKWQNSIKVQIDMDDYRPITSTSKPPASSSTPAPSKPQCGANGYTAPSADVDNVNKQLDAKGSQKCCTTEEGGCTNIGSSGKIAVDLCADPGEALCVSCARLANYVAGIGSACQQKQGNTVMVGGTQDIVETPGLKVEI